MSHMADNVQQVRENIAAACARANRDPNEITLVAVSKKKPVSDVLAALQAGVHHFGENRLSESQSKLPAVADQLAGQPAPHWHFVGHIQSRKAKDILSLFPVIHSLDSLKLANKIARIADELPHTPAVFIQVNVSGEKQKYGFQGENWQTDPAVRDALFDQMRQITSLGQLHIRGLMTLAPYGAPEATLRGVFASLAALRAELQTELDIPLPDLSMGMTDDYPIAIEEGATVIRVGRALFGERQY